MSQKRMVCIAVLFFMFFNIVHIVNAEEEQFGITLDCFDSCKDKTIDSSKDIMLVLTIKNNFDYWVSIGEENNNNVQSVFHMDIENNNLQGDYSQQAGKRSVSYDDILGKRFLIKPKSELQIYVPFDTYNQLGKDNRLGDWKIYPELRINNKYNDVYANVNFYNNPFDSKPRPLNYNINGQTQYTVTSPIKGNVLEFKTVKQETIVQVEKSNTVVPEGLLENLYKDYIKEIIAGVAIIVIGYVITTRLPKTKSKKR
jgi:hypothetical protein